MLYGGGHKTDSEANHEMVDVDNILPPDPHGHFYYQHYPCDYFYRDTDSRQLVLPL